MQRQIGLMGAGAVALAMGASDAHAAFSVTALLVDWPDAVSCTGSRQFIVGIQGTRTALYPNGGRIGMQLLAYDDDPTTEDELIGETAVLIPASNTSSVVYGTTFLGVECEASDSILLCVPGGNIGTFSGSAQSFEGIYVRVDPLVRDASTGAIIDFIPGPAPVWTRPGGVCAKRELVFDREWIEFDPFDFIDDLRLGIELPWAQATLGQFEVPLDLSEADLEVLGATLNGIPLEIAGTPTAPVLLFVSDEPLPGHRFEIALETRRFGERPGFGSIQIPRSAIFIDGNGERIPFSGAEVPVASFTPASEPASFDTSLIEVELFEAPTAEGLVGVLRGARGAVSSDGDLLASLGTLVAVARDGCGSDPESLFFGPPPPDWIPGASGTPAFGGSARLNDDGSFEMPLFGASMPRAGTILLRADEGSGPGTAEVAIPFGSVCPGDVTGDGVKDIFDIIGFFALFSQSC